MSTLPSGRPVAVADEEPLARFLPTSSWYNAVGVKPAAFLPNPANGETSVFRHGKTPEEPLWAIGQSIVSGSTRNIYGVAFVAAGDVRSETLGVTAKEPPERHANIDNWPVDTDPVLQKAKHKEIAMCLAGKSDLLKKP